MARGIPRYHYTLANPPYCPLCGGRMVSVKDQVRNVWVFACHKDRIATAVTDPLVGRWEELGNHQIPCPMPSCETKMRVFFTSTGAMVAKCPKCGAGMKNTNVDRLAMPEAPALALDGLSPEAEEKLKREKTEEGER